MAGAMSAATRGSRGSWRSSFRIRPRSSIRERRVASATGRCGTRGSDAARLGNGMAIMAPPIITLMTADGEFARTITAPPTITPMAAGGGSARARALLPREGVVDPNPPRIRQRPSDQPGVAHQPPVAGRQRRTEPPANHLGVIHPPRLRPGEMQQGHRVLAAPRGPKPRRDAPGLPREEEEQSQRLR